MRKSVLLSLSLALVWLAGPRSASASTINFSDLSQSGTGRVSFGGTVLEDGFTFTSNLNSGRAGLSIWKDSDLNHPVGGSATTSLFEYEASNTTTITRTGGGAFELDAIDLANWGVGLAGFPAMFDVTFLGTKTDFSTVTQTFSVANSLGQPQLQTFLFSGFSDLVGVSMLQGQYGLGTAFQFDNLVVGGDGTPAPVPEPATLLLLGSGMAGLVARWRRSSGSQ